MKSALDRLCQDAEQAAKDHVRILILSDRALEYDRAAIPALLACGAVHHHLNRRKIRMRLSLVVDSGEARDTHQMACLFGFGASAVCPHLAFETIRELVESDKTAKKPHSATEGARSGKVPRPANGFATKGARPWRTARPRRRPPSARRAERAASEAGEEESPATSKKEW
jgi:hypothetical protein